MKNSTDELEVDSGQARSRRVHSRIRGLRGHLTNGLGRVAAVLEGHPWIGLAAITALYIQYIKRHQGLHLPWHDELFTYYISQAPTFGRMIQETQHIDLNPPLYYIATRFVFHFLHPSSFSLRLPSIAAFFLAALCLYFFVSKRLTRVYGLLAAMVLLGCFFKNYAFEARPYAFVLGFLGLGAVGWQMAMEEDRRRRWLGLLLVLLGGFGMLLSHVLALIAYGAFFFAELVRLALRRKPDWALWIALAAPLCSTILYRPLFESHGAAGVSFPTPFQASLSRLSASIGSVWSDLGPLFAAAAILIILLAERDFRAGRDRPRFSIAEATFAIYLLFVPLIITILFMRSHSAYFDRYGMASVFGAGILVPWLIASWTGVSQVAGLLTAIVFVFGIISPTNIADVLQKRIHPIPVDSGPDLTGDSTIPLPDVDPRLPIVDASGLTFLEMDSRETSAFLSRVYYLLDPQAALQYSHATIFDGFGQLKHIFPIRANVMPYEQFIQQHQTFLVYGTFDYPEDWILRKLLADGATARYVGNFPRGYKDTTLYEVTLPQR